MSHQTKETSNKFEDRMFYWNYLNNTVLNSNIQGILFCFILTRATYSSWSLLSVSYMNTSFYTYYIICNLQDLINAITGNYFVLFNKHRHATRHVDEWRHKWTEKNYLLDDVELYIKGKPT